MAASSAPAAPATKIPDSVVSVSDSDGNHQGIPEAIFFEDVSGLVEKYEAPALIDKLSALSQKFRYFEEKLVKSRDSLEEKVVEVQRALKAVKTLEEKSTRGGDNVKEFHTQFELSDGLYVRATVPPTKSVCLWLGANVMVEYSLGEAIELLTKNLASAETNITETRAEITYLRDQINTTDVNLSRAYNVHVQSVRRSSSNDNATKPKESQKDVAI